MPDWNKIALLATNVVKSLAPIVDVAVPGAASAIAIATQIVQGVVAAEPAAVALYNRIMTGEDVTAEQLQAYIADNEDSYAELQAAIAAKLASLPPG